MYKKLVHITFFLLCFGLNQSVNAEKLKSAINYYGHTFEINANLPEVFITVPFTNEKLNQLILNLNHSELISELDEYSLTYSLDDLAYLQLVKKIAAHHYENLNNQKLFIYSLLRQKGYDVILGFTTNNMHVYGQTSFTLFNTLWVQHKNKNYYDLTFEKTQDLGAEQLLKIENTYSARAIVVNEINPPKLNALSGNYNLRFDFEGFDYYIKGKFNKSLALYFNDLPDIAFSSIYLNYGMSNLAKEGLITSLKNAIYGMHQTKAINLILRFTQEAFPYRNDLDNNGKEKFSFPEELLANPQSDCEDKSVMFAYLAKEVLNLKTLALIYYSQHHFNVAIAGNERMPFDFVYKEQNYLVCEPSGKNFNAGDNVYNIKQASMVEW